jgi:chromosome segregation ATPase
MALSNLARSTIDLYCNCIQVNGKRCQFKDVAKLLRAKGIDLDHNRFLILQVISARLASVKYSFLKQ